MPASAVTRQRPASHYRAIVELVEPRALLSTYTVTNLSDAGPGSLREAVQQANANPGSDTINFAAGLSGAIVLVTPIEISDTSGTTTVLGTSTSATAIGGPGFIVDAGASARFSAAAIGQFVNRGNLSVDACDTDIIDNEGGTVAAAGCLMQAIGSAQGAAMYNNGGAVTLTRDQIVEATSSTGSAVYSNGGSIALRDCSLVASGGQGNGMNLTGGSATVTQTTLWTVAQDINVSSATVTLVNSTLRSMTINPSGTSGDVTLYNTIVVGSITGTLDQHLAAGQAPSSFNLIGTTQAGGLTDAVNGNHVGVNPKLASAPGFAGGGIQTVIPLPGSPAIDAGSSALALDPTGMPLTADARGFARVFNGHVDIGAAETQPFLVNSGTIQSTAPGEMTLTEAMGLAGLYSTPVRFDPAVFAPGTSHVVRLVGDINRSVTVQGPGRDVATLQVNPQGPGIGANATFSLSGVTVTGATGAAFFNNGTFEVDDCAFTGNKNGLGGGAIWNFGGTLHVTRSTFTGNSAASGGAVYNSKGQTAVLEGCTFVNNSATSGGGAIANAGNLTLVNCTFSGNSATSQGGAISNPRQDNISGLNLTPHLVVTNCTIVGNAAPAGGGLAVTGGAVTVNNSIVVRNTAADHTTASDISGTVTGSNNLIGTGGSGGLVNGTSGNLVGVADPKLGPLGDYGGPAETIPLLSGSPALDAGSNALAVDASGNPQTSDQRGLSRIFNGTVDIGAYEAQPPAVAGDVNHDGTVNFSDLLSLAQHYGSTTQPLWEGGDLTGDGSVAFPDLLVLAQNYGRSAATAQSLDWTTQDLLRGKVRHGR